MIAFICKGLSPYFYSKLENLETLEEKYNLLKKSKNDGCNIIFCIGSHGLLKEEIEFNMLIKSGKKFNSMNQSKGISKKIITFKF